MFNSIMCTGFPQESLYKDFLHQPFAITEIICVDDIWYYGKALLEKGGELALEAWSDPVFFASVKIEFTKRGENLLAAAPESFEAFCKAYEAFMPLIILVYVVEQPVEQTLKEELSHLFSQAKVSEVMDDLNIPLEDNMYKREEYELVTTDDLLEHVKKYQSLYSRYGEERKYTLEDAKKKLDSINKEEFLEAREKERNHLKEVIQSTKELLKEKAYLVDLFQYMVFYRTERTDIVNQSLFLAIPTLRKKAESLQLSYQELLACTEGEILSGKIPPKDFIAQREGSYAIMLDKGELKILYDKELEDLREILKDEIVNVQSITGTVASRGKVSGEVKKVFTREEYDKVNEGDILVTSMTTPEMIPIMKKAVAFITDEGGVTCHAAIIARELKKPCIIGTKVATQVLKDGDLVEVDAERGIVKILERSPE